MNKHVQIRDVPEATHRKLKARAAERGMSISDYLRRLIEADLRKPDWEEFFRRAEKLEPVTLQEPSAEMIRRERDSR